MSRKSLMIGLTLSCAIALGIGKAEAAAPTATSELHLSEDWQPGPSQQERKKSSDPAIVTEDGPLKGIISPDLNEFLGIPYAAPPVGALRWTPPQPHGHWQGVLEATQLGNVCPQRSAGGIAGDEDCLFLNVYTPGLKKNENKHDGLPVMVWIHGGDLVRGAGGFYDPTLLVEKGNVIVVTINYRLGILGFFAHPAIDAEGHDNGNYGLMDQQFSLQWVQRNIAAFGGDPDRVTIFGESAGGLSVYSHLASPTAEGLFHRAIAQSGAYTSFQRYQQQRIVPLVTAEGQGAAFAASVGCDNQTAQCLRAASVATLVNKQPGSAYPILDGNVLVQPPGPAFASGRFKHVPVITGSNHDEYRLFVAQMFGNSLSNAAYPAVTTAFLGPLAAFLGPLTPPLNQQVLSLYPLSNYPSPPAPLALGAWLTDVIYACSGRNAALLLSSQQAPTYAYEFNDENAPLVEGIAPPVSFPMGAYHFSEVQYLFNLGKPAPFTADQQQLSDTMIAYWTQFAATGDPNLPGAPVWSPYNAQTDQFQSLAPPTPTVESDFDAEHKCSSFWNTL